MILRSVTYTLVLAVFLPLAFLSAILGTWAGDRTPPTRLLSTELLTPAVRPGSTLQVKYVVQRDRACETRVDRALFDVDGRRKPLEDIDGAAPLGPTTYIATADIPTYFSPGTARYVTSSVYQCNPLHRLFPIVASTREIEFEVVR